VYAWVARDGPDSRIHCTGYISDSLLVALYRNTIGLVFPASGEGFGLPVLEAMHFGVPVLASQDGAQSELIGRAGIMLPPDDEESWRRAMCELLLDAKKRERFAGLAANEAMNYSWHSTAIKTLHVYEEAVDLDDKR
jgi:glycosyltransferase involved in cell wall biosynthesis